MEAKITKVFKKKQERIEWLSKNCDKVSSGICKREALKLIQKFHDGIQNDKWGLERLQPDTVAGKTRAGYDAPSTPLYGKGDRRQSKRDTYMNMMRLFKVSNGWVVKVSEGMHWSGVPLAMLFEVHERGAKITGSNGAIIVIPKRPAWRYAVREFRSKLKMSFEEEYQKMAKGFIQSGAYRKKMEDLIKLLKAKDNREAK